MADRVKVHDTLKSLEVESGMEPYRFGLPGNKVIVFPDPTEMPWDRAEALMAALNNPETGLREALALWLSAADFEKLVAAGLTMRQMAALAAKVMEHYGAILGTLPE